MNATAEDAGRPYQKHEDHRHPDDKIAELSQAEIERQPFDDPNQDAADHRAAQIAHAADRHDRRGFETEGKAGIGIGEPRPQRVEEPCHTGQAGR